MAVERRAAYGASTGKGAKRRLQSRRAPARSVAQSSSGSGPLPSEGSNESRQQLVRSLLIPPVQSCCLLWTASINLPLFGAKSLPVLMAKCDTWMSDWHRVQRDWSYSRLRECS